VIDDFTESGVNGALEATETVSPGDLDVIAAMVRGHLDALTLSDGSRCASSPFVGLSRHGDHQGAVLKGRLWDLSGAYRQLARRPADAALTVIAVFDPVSRGPRFYEQPALAFGASSSVLSFNWTAGALAIVLVRLFLISTTNFYDDFTVVELESLTRSCSIVVGAVFDLLGWLTKELPDFSGHPEALGSRLDLRDSAGGRAVISNRPERVQEICSTIEQALEANHLTFEDMRRLRGRLIHARAQTFGRFGGGCFEPARAYQRYG